MTLIQHTNENVRFQQQVDNAHAHVLPFIEQAMKVTSATRVLEIGCGEGGVMVPFLEKGCKVTGIELADYRVEMAKKFLDKYVKGGRAEVVNMNIYDESALQQYRGAFDLILLKDVIEHIPDQERFIPYLKQYLKPGGRIFFGFPPWYMPHGGHQQLCRNRVLTYLPYFHLLPGSLYVLFLKLFGEPQGSITELLEIKSTGISIERFERIVRKSGYLFEKKTHFLINPIYQYKFGWKPRKQVGWISNIPFFRNFVTTCVYYLIRN